MKFRLEKAASIEDELDRSLLDQIFFFARYCTVHTDTGSNVTSYSYFFVLAKLCIYYQLYYHLQGPVREVEKG